MGKGSSKRRPPTPGGAQLNVSSKALVSDKPPNQIVICKQSGCHDISTTTGFCRFHYLASWRKLKTKEARKKGIELESYLEELTRRFPEEFLQKLKLEVEEMSEKESMGEGEEGIERAGGLFDQMEDDEDLETIIQGLKVEDF
jgi:hypothetical protein